MRMRVAIIIARVFACGLAFSPVRLNMDIATGIVDKEIDDHHELFLQSEDFELASKMPISLPTAAEQEAMENSQLFEGDIEGFSLDPLRNKIKLTNKKSVINLTTSPGSLWPNGRVPYVMEAGMNSKQRAAIAQAVDEYNKKTCIRFVPKEDRDRDFVFIKRTGANGCSSFVGRMLGSQPIDLATNCYSKGTVVHEFMHSLGFFHEQSRPDRNQFVRIVEENMKPGTQGQFEMFPPRILDTAGFRYDYGSVMHYPRNAFSKNGRDTVVPLERNARIGQRIGLSATDAAKINKAYKC